MLQSALVSNVLMDNTGEEEGGKSRGGELERGRVWGWKDLRPVYISILFTTWNYVL